MFTAMLTSVMAVLIKVNLKFTGSEVICAGILVPSPCGVVGIYESFGRTYCYHPQG
jgi:hypothetical protein